MAKYHLHVTSSDSLGMNMLESVVELANMGAVLKPNTIPRMGFPHSCSMVLESDIQPTPKATVRVFEYDTNIEIFSAPEPVTPPVASGFSLNEVDTYTKESLDAMEWDKLKDLCKSKGISGRDRQKITKLFLDAVEKDKESV